MKLRIVQSIMRSDRIKQIRLVPHDALPSDGFAPGAHVTFAMSIGGEIQHRQYSVMAYEARDALLVHFDVAVLHEAEGRGGSRWMHDLLEGDSVDASGPVNAFPFREDPSACVFLAGGIGITPLLSMARAAARTGRAFQFHYFTRDGAHPPFAQELHALPGQDNHIWPGLDATAARAQLGTILDMLDESSDIYVCGPNGMIDSVRELCDARGIAPARVRFERFGAPPAPVAAGSYSVRLEKSGKQFVVAPHQTLLEALTAQGIAVHSSCAAGVCGTCLVEVIEGDIDHQDAFLLDCDRDEGRLMCACVSRAKGSHLTLDL